jgi:hypothetical protein
MSGFLRPFGTPADEPPGDEPTADDSGPEKLAADPFATFRAKFAEGLGADAVTTSYGPPVSAESVPVNPTEPAWMSIIEDPFWLDDAEDTGAEVDLGALRARFAMPDIPAGVRTALERLFSQYTLDFEIQYQQGYQVFEDANRHVEAMRQRAVSPEFSPLADELRATVDQQAATVAEMLAEHQTRHGQYREKMAEIMPDLIKQSQAANAENLALMRKTNTDILNENAARMKRERDAADRRNQNWLDDFRSR